MTEDEKLIFKERLRAWSLKWSTCSGGVQLVVGRDLYRIIYRKISAQYVFSIALKDPTKTDLELDWVIISSHDSVIEAVVAAYDILHERTIKHMEFITDGDL